jgi:hypothetical protein
MMESSQAENAVPESIPRPNAVTAIPLPISEPTRPNRVVIQIGIGSGPGTAQRARPPMTKPMIRAWMIAPIMAKA